MKKSLAIFAFVIVLLTGCSERDTQNSIQTVPEPNQEFDEQNPPGVSMPDTSLDHPPTDVDRFREVRKEIDHWHDRPPRSIGSLHKQQLLDRLLPLRIDQEEKDLYVQKLNSILLADDPEFLEEQRKQREAEQKGHQQMYCEGNNTVPFTSPPIRIEDLGFISPLGAMTGHHVTPTDHGYIHSKAWTNPGAKREDNVDKFADVLSPAAGLVSVGVMPAVFATSTIGDYHITIYHSCSFFTILIHVNEISDKLKTALETRVPARVEAGEVIGRSPGFDFAVYNDKVKLGLINPETYEAEPWKIHTDDIFAHFVEPIRSQLLEKNLRKEEPRSGKLDYDVDGTIAGNWFVENTNGYKGLPEYGRLIGYWKTHLSFAYDAIDPDVMVISMGDFNGETGIYTIEGNSPDFKDVTKRSGMVKYELVRYSYYDGDKLWDRGHFADLTVKPQKSVEGVALAQMLEDRKIKFESFPKKTSSEVKGFSANAKIYVR